MSSLFDQLKSAGPVKRANKSPAKSVSPTKKLDTLEELLNKHKSMLSGTRRESLPSPLTISTVLKKPKPQKARSLSPAKYGPHSGIKSLKVKLERKKLEEFLTRPLEEHANNIRKKQEKPKAATKLPKVTPTKAQQKQFEPLVEEKKSNTQVLEQFNVKPCKVRIHRDDLTKLAKDFQNKNALIKENKLKSMKRPALITSGDSPPSKKGKITNDSKINRSKSNFFIKLNTSPPSKLDKKLKSISKSPSLSSEAFHNKMKNSKFNHTTMPTKFSRSELFRSFGKRFFNVHVKVERCTHPLMLTFESNERARRLQNKRNNKSKNLSVSFSEQVEIFGDSSDPDDSCDEDFCAVPVNRSNRKGNANNSFPVPATPVVMPARLKKVENGKVVDDIKLDPTLFMDPKIFSSSTPYSPGRKKRDHSKSFSPLKDETSPSPRKEQLKLANERVELSSLRRLNIEDDEDEDDDCEYIVPIELPQRRTSRTSSNTTLEDLTSADLPLNIPDSFNKDDNTDNINFTTNTTNNEISNPVPTDNVESNDNGSDDSFQSAQETQDQNHYIYDNADNQFSSLRTGLNLDIEVNKADKKLQQTNGNVCNEAGNQHLDDISLNLFMEDSQTNDDNHSKSFVVSLINETIDKLSKDIEENAANKHCNDTT